jgi:NADH dehydrogenase
LYQVATGGLSPANIASPLRSVLRRQKHTNVVLAEVTDFDLANRRLILQDSESPALHYDTLIVATGSQFNYFGHDHWQTFAPGLKSLEDALAIRSKVLSAFERAELEFDPKREQEALTFVVVGGGPTGVEMAGAVAELAHFTLRHEFRHITPSNTRVLLFEAGPEILSMFPPDLRQKAHASLERLGVTVRTGVRVVDIHADGATIEVDGKQEAIPAATVLWTAGVKASSLGAALARAAGQETDRSGRVTVTSHCSLPGHPEIFVIGDLANFTQEGKSLPGLAPVAMQQGRYVADLIMRRLKGKSPPPPFHYHDKGTLATIGRSAAVADLGWIKLSGFLAWVTWLLVHIMYLIQFQNRVLVMTQWAFNYVTRGRAARLITGEAVPASREGEPARAE